ncbi:MAG TPA: PAS domain-containing sensor histidine kinase [Methanospirillum sp.]|nr:PAS domain-containing sensor histidine kinase [Methanospirillum sp.]
MTEEENNVGIDLHNDISLVLEGFVEPICFLDSNLDIFAINHAFLELFEIRTVIKQGTSLRDVVTDGEAIHQVLRAIETMRGGSAEQVECICSHSDLDGVLVGYRFVVSPISLSLLKHGFSIKVYRTHEPSAHLDYIDQYTLLTGIIYESTINLKKNGHIRRFIQQIISRIGPVISSDFVSYLEVADSSHAGLHTNEIFLWSRKYGFLIGELFDDESSAISPHLVDPGDKSRARISIPISYENAPEPFRRLMFQREISDILLFPVVPDDRIHGFLIIWTDENLSDNPVVGLLETISLLIGASIHRFRSDESLIRSDEKFRSVVDHIGDMYYKTDKSGYLLDFSPSMATTLEYSSTEELYGIQMETLLKDPDGWPLFLSEVLNNDGVKDYELVFLGKRGKTISGSVNCRLVYGSDGSLKGIEGIIRDISRRRQYEQMVQESEWKLEQAQKIARLGVWSYTPDMGVFRVSPEVFSLLMISDAKNSVTLDDLIEMTNRVDKEKFSVYFKENVKAGLSFQFEFIVDLPEGKFRYIRIKGQPRIRDGIISGSFGILQDITERKEVEQHLLKYANELEHKTLELDVMRTQLLDMNRDLDQRVRMRTGQIEQLLKQKDEFIMQIGHDLKTPLTPLVAILPYIRKKTIDPELCELLDVSIDDVRTIKKMITTVLDLAQMNALYTVSDIQSLPIKEGLDHIISDNSYLIHQKSLTVLNDIPSDYKIMMSSMHFETLMGNLIGNAVKYSYIDGIVTLKAHEMNDSIVVSIQDQGIGISSEVLPRIFDEFYKADSSRHDRESNGLGLAIVRRVVDMYSGSISVQSDGEGKGSVFTISLKKNPPAHSLNGRLHHIDKTPDI